MGITFDELFDFGGAERGDLDGRSHAEAVLV